MIVRDLPYCVAIVTIEPSDRNFVGGIVLFSLPVCGFWILESVIEQAKPTQPTFYGSAAPDIEKSVFIPVAAPYTSLDEGFRRNCRYLTF